MGGKKQKLPPVQGQDKTGESQEQLPTGAGNCRVLEEEGTGRHAERESKFVMERDRIIFELFMGFYDDDFARRTVPRDLELFLIHDIGIVIILTLDYFIAMTGRYKDDTFHLLQTFNKTARRQTGFGLSSEHKPALARDKKSDTWDAQHMTTFLNESNYSNWSRGEAKEVTHFRRNHARHSSSDDYFFKTTKDNKNVSKFGYTQVNPLVVLPEVSVQRSQVLKQFLEKQAPSRSSSPQPALLQDGRFLFQSNSVKFRATDPLTHKHTPYQSTLSNPQKQRMKFLIAKRHPHGITGIDNCQNPTIGLFPNQTMQIRTRQQPDIQQTHILDKEWKSKGRVSEQYKEEYGFTKGRLIQVRKFRNDDTHGYNIVTNRKSP